MRVRQLVLLCACSPWKMLLFLKDYALLVIHSSHFQRWRSFSERFSPRMIMPENLQNLAKFLFVLILTRLQISHVRVHTTKTLWLGRLEKQTIMLRSVPQMLKKVKNCRKQNFKGEANKMQLNKEDTRWSNLNGKCVFNILILSLFVLIMFNKFTCKVRFHIAVWSQSKCYKNV